jgi:1,2-dihydroxy-3-keto-5-methylthiopentene dioxygenase
MKIYEIETLKTLTVNDLKRESAVTALEQVDLKEVMNMISSGKYASFDEVSIDENTPDELLQKFSKEHLHTDDEVRYFLSGNSVFDVRSASDVWIRIEVGERDFITVPKNLYHRYFAPDKKAKALRLFTGTDGWVPVYREKL